MSKSAMELRSSRSRSRTPFLSQELIDKEVLAAGNHVQKTVVRTTRRTTVVRTDENASSSTDEVNTSRDTSHQSKASRRSAVSDNQKSERSLRSRILKTSDYSSEDGENEVSSTKTISQNERNQLIENARTLANGSDMPALELYKKSGRYWDVYPKTDWTYSYHSKDRVEIAPGVVAMPNMSRKTIHALDESNRSESFESSRNLYSEHVSHKNTNTENTFASRYDGSAAGGARGSSFNNNSEDYYIKRRSYSRWSSFKSSVTTIFTSIFTSIFTVFYYTYRTQTSMFSYIHRAASQVMLWDTYLLWKSRPGDKARKLALLCLLPLLLFGGLWFLSSLGGALYGAVANYTASSTTFIPALKFWDSNKEKIEIIRRERAADFAGDLDRTNFDINTNFDVDFEHRARLDSNIHRASDSVHQQTIIEEKIIKITEKIYVEPPSASEVAGSLSREQLEAIALAIKSSLDVESRSQIDTDELVERIIRNPSFYNVVNNYYQTEHSENIKLSREGSGDSSSSYKANEELLNKHQVLIDTLLKEIENMKQEIWLNNKHRSEDYARLSLDIKKCCNKRPIINVEGYVTRVVSDLLNNPEFLRSQNGLNDWLRSLFIAKQDLEYRLGNLTANMDSKMAALVESNSHILMDRVAAQLVDYTKQNVHHVREVRSEVNVAHSVTDALVIKKIVKDALAIYDADRTGLVDYAMETMGGQIVTTRCTEPYHYGKAVVSVLGIPLWHPTNSPRTVITPSIAPGECWAFQNFPGFIVIKLSSKVKINAFTMEHISRLLVPEGKIDSAPKEFEVYGLKTENDKEPVLLGTYKFDYDGDPVQFFMVEKDDQIFDMIEVRIMSNHGNPNYTCLYRFRVHGNIHHEQER